MANATSADELLERLRSRRQLPPADERQRIREAAGLSLRQVGDALGVTHSLIRHWERGGTPREQHAAYAELLERLRGVAAD